jgi:fibronectin type 3 domain-containing protein
MAVTGTPCPETRERAATLILKVGTGNPDLLLPMIAVVPTAVTTSAATVATTAVAGLPLPPAAPPQVKVLRGDVQAQDATVWLRWEPPGDVDAYRVYRGDRDEDAAALLVELPPDATAYYDATAGCDLRYYVTTVAAGGESLPSAAVYYGPLCQGPAQ